MALSENKQRMMRGELYHAFTPELVAERARSKAACNTFNNIAPEASRRRAVELWRNIICDQTPLPPLVDDPEKDSELFAADPWVEAPIKMDYGTNVRLGAGVFVNFNAVFLDTCLITIGARTLVGPNCSFYSGTHPLDPLVRNGTEGPELGKEIWIGEDCWLGGNVMILPGVKIGRGSVIGAGSVVTKDVPEFHVAAGNPAKILRRIETKMDPAQSVQVNSADKIQGAEEPMANMA